MLKKILLSIFIIGFPLGSYYYLKTGWDKRKSLLEQLGKYDVIKPFNLTDQMGNPFTQDSILGKVVIVDFIFTRCGTICPAMSKKMQFLHETLKTEKNVILVSHTIDPDYDTPQVLKEYAKIYDAEYPQWRFVTGNKQDIYNLAAHTYKISVVDEGNGTPDDLTHSDKFILIDSNGQIRAYKSGQDESELKKLIELTAYLIPNTKKKIEKK